MTMAAADTETDTVNKDNDGGIPMVESRIDECDGIMTYNIHGYLSLVVPLSTLSPKVQKRGARTVLRAMTNNSTPIYFFRIPSHPWHRSFSVFASHISTRTA